MMPTHPLVTAFRGLCGWACRLFAGLACFAIATGLASAADVTFNITLIAESDPLPPPSGTTFTWADVWAEGGYAYMGTDRTGYGVAIFSIANSGVPTFLPPPTSPPSGFAATTYFGSEMEDVEVWNGIGYFASDVNGSSGRTGVDIVDLSIPFDPIQLSRVDTSDCLPGSPTTCAHGKVHTLSVSKGYLYTSDNETDVIKITNVSNPANPVLVRSLDIGAPSSVASHEVIVRNDRMYVASKRNDTTGLTCCGWTHIYDVSNPAFPVLLKAFESGPRSHTALPSDDGKLLIVAEERPNGNVNIYDISMIDQPNDPQNPVLLSSLNAGSVGIDAHSPHHPHLHGNLLFLPWYEAGLQVFNISDPAHPVHVGAFDTFPGTAANFSGNWGVDLSMGLNRVLLSDRQRGLIVVDASGVLLPGDYNQDMIVDTDDYLDWRAAYGTSDSGLHTGAFADGNYSGRVDAADYILWRKHLGQTGPHPPGSGAANGAAVVPEPTAFLALLSGICLLACRGRVRR